MDEQQLKMIVEAALLAAEEPLSLDRLLALFAEEEAPSREAVRAALTALAGECEGRGIELREVGSGFRFQVRRELAPWVSRLWEERPPRYSRALLETLALIAYRQPITRAEIEEVRGVSVSTNIIRTLQEREWIRVVGHRDVPGRPAMYATTRQFLDYFGLKSLDELPTLAEIRDLDQLGVDLPWEASADGEAPAGAEPGGEESETQDREAQDRETPAPEAKEAPETQQHEAGTGLAEEPGQATLRTGTGSAAEG